MKISVFFILSFIAHISCSQILRVNCDTINGKYEFSKTANGLPPRYYSIDNQTLMTKMRIMGFNDLESGIPQNVFNIYDICSKKYSFMYLKEMIPVDYTQLKFTGSGLFVRDFVINRRNAYILYQFQGYKGGDTAGFYSLVVNKWILVEYKHKKILKLEKNLNGYTILKVADDSFPIPYNYLNKPSIPFEGRFERLIEDGFHQLCGERFFPSDYYLCYFSVANSFKRGREVTFTIMPRNRNSKMLIIPITYNYELSSFYFKYLPNNIPKKIIDKYSYEKRISAK